MFSQRTNERLAGALLVAGFAAFMGHVVTLFVLEGLAVTIGLVLLYGLVMMPAGLLLYQSLRAHERSLALLGAAWVAAHGLWLVLVSALILVEPRLEEAFRGEPEIRDAVVRAVELVMDSIRSAAFVFLGLGLVVLGVLILRSRTMARWIGWLGLAMGALGAASWLANLFGVAPGGPRSPLLVAALLGACLFLLVLGVRLLARETGAAT